MYAGLPCIATRCECGPAELIREGENGFLVPIGDVEQMANKMYFLMSNEEKRTEFGAHAKESVKRLEKSQISERWLQMVFDVVG